MQTQAGSVWWRPLEAAAIVASIASLVFSLVTYQGERRLPLGFAAASAVAFLLTWRANRARTRSADVLESEWAIPYDTGRTHEYFYERPFRRNPSLNVDYIRGRVGYETTARRV